MANKSNKNAPFKPAVPTPTPPVAPAVPSNGADTPAVNATADEKNKKASKAYIVYVDAPTEVDGKAVEGKAHNSPVSTAKVMRVEFANNVKREVALESLKPEIVTCATLQGLATRVQRSYQTLKNVDECIEAYDETMQDIVNGVWIESKAGAPRVTQLAEAIKASLEAAGQTVDEIRMQSIIEKLKQTDYMEKAQKNEHVQMHLANLRLAAAQKRALEAKASAKNAAPSTLADF